VVKVLIGMPLREDGSDTDSTPYVRVFVEDFSKKFPALTVELRDEAYTSKLAMQAMVQAGVKKKQRREKGNLDKLSATIILQEYLG
jgi:putative Holliday junction resolvase